MEIFEEFQRDKAKHLIFWWKRKESRLARRFAGMMDNCDFFITTSYFELRLLIHYNCFFFFQRAYQHFWNKMQGKINLWRWNKLKYRHQL
jgi:hypothetical protein